MREVLNIKNDFTPEEEKFVKSQVCWAFSNKDVINDT